MRRSVLWVVGLLVSALALLGTAVALCTEDTPPTRSGAAAVPSGPDLPDEPALVPRVLVPEMFGATGDGRTDDAAALQRGLDALRRGDVLRLTPGRTYAHGDVLVVRREGSALTGPGTLLATREEQSSLQLEADDVRVSDVELAVAATRKRWEGRDQHRLLLGPHSGVRVDRVVVRGSAAAGVFVDGASGFVIDRVVVRGTRADGIHITGGARDGLVLSPHVVDSGDDGVAVVSYERDRGTSQRIRVESPRVDGTSGGRGLTVVGGKDVTWIDVQVRDTQGAAVYVASEGAPYHTRGVRGVRLLRGEVVRANRDVRTDHGAVLVYAGARGTSVRDVQVSELTVRDTRRDATRQVGLLGVPGRVHAVRLRQLAIDGGGPAFEAVGAASDYRLERWTVDGRRQPDRDARGGDTS